MVRKDYSREIFKKYYNREKRTLEITLKDKTILEGKLTGFIHGDENVGEPYIIRWHFLDKDEVFKEYSKIINQADIKSVKFKI